MSKPPPPTPSHILRSHTAEVTCLSISDDNERLYSADVSGTVVITSTRTTRPIASWKAHTASILGAEEWGDSVITHGRDNKIHVWTLAEIEEVPVRGSAASPVGDLPTPKLGYSLDVNALNYCRFSLLPLPDPSRALIAVPNLVDSALVDIWELPTAHRLHAAIGKLEAETRERGQINATGLLMSLHLFTIPALPSPSAALHTLTAYENGSVVLRRCSVPLSPSQTFIEGRGWERVWSSKLHAESVMAMALSRDHTLALSVSADHLIGRYDLTNGSSTVHRTKHPGNACIAIRDDGKVCAVGGWDGKIRLYTTKTLKPLGTLEYHKSSCQAVAFARSDRDAGEESDEEMSLADRRARRRWLLGGGKEGRVSVWSLMEF